MLDKKLILQLYKKRHSYAQISRIMSVSRQRIHQILTGYHAGLSRTKQGKKIIESDCKICYGRAASIHHIDRNPKNNRPQNLLSICNSCHYELHRGEKRHRFTHYKFYLCLWCGKRFRRTIGYSNGISKFCSRKCFGQYQTIENSKNKKWSRKYFECVVCQRTNYEHTALGMCSKCYTHVKYIKSLN